MATQIPREIYPLATQNGQAIPLDIVKPVKMTKLAVASDSLASITFASDHEIAFLYSDVDVVLSFTGESFTLPLANGTEYNDAIFVPAYTLMTVEVLAGAGKAVSLAGSGYLIIQFVEKWAALAIPNRAISRN